MLTEQNTPLPLVRQWSNLIPHCWEDLDELADKTRATQPSNMAADAELYAAMSIVQAHAVNGALPVEISHASFELFCCALWRRNKVVYTFDDTLAAELVQQADEWDDSDNLPIEVLLHPPYRCAFISCSGVIDPEIIGFFPFIVRDMDKGTPVFYVCVVYKTFSTLTMPLYLNGLTVGDCINATTKAANRAKHPDGYEVNLDRTTILRYLNLYLYICAANADIASTPAQTYRPRWLPHRSATGSARCSHMIPVWQSARPCAERRPRRKTPKHSSAALLVGAAATFARTLVADTGTTFGLAVSPSRKAAKSFCAGCIRCWSVAAMNRTQPRFTQSNNQLYDFLENGSKWSKKFKINISKVEAIRPFFYALKSNFIRHYV